MKNFLGESRHYLCAVAPYVSMGVRVELPWEAERGFQAWNTVIEARKLLQYSFRMDENGDFYVDFNRKRRGQPKLLCFESGSLEEHMLTIHSQTTEIEEDPLVFGYVRVYRDSFEFAVSVNHFVMDGTALSSFIKDYVRVYEDEAVKPEICGHIEDLQEVFQAKGIGLSAEDTIKVRTLNAEWQERFSEFTVSSDDKRKMTEYETETAPFAFLRATLFEGDEFVSFHKETKERGLTIGDVLIAATIKAFPERGCQVAVDVRGALGIDARTLGTVATGVYIPPELQSEEVHTRIEEGRKNPYATLLKNCSLNGGFFDASYLAAYGEFRDAILYEFKNYMGTNMAEFAVVSNMKAVDFGQSVSEAWFLPYRMAKNSIAVGFITTADTLSVTVGYSSAQYTRQEIEAAIETMQNVDEDALWMSA